MATNGLTKFIETIRKLELLIDHYSEHIAYVFSFCVSDFSFKRIQFHFDCLFVLGFTCNSSQLPRLLGSPLPSVSIMYGMCIARRHYNVLFARHWRSPAHTHAHKRPSSIHMLPFIFYRVINYNHTYQNICC